MVRRQREPGTVEELAKTIQNRSTIEEIHDNRLDTEFKSAVVATSLARHLCEHIECLPIGAQTRILDTHDYLQMMVPLIDEPPWTRRRKSSKTGNMVWEKLYDNRDWREVAPSDLLQITQCEAQCWLAVFHLTCSNTCRERYALNVFRKELLLRLRKYLNEVVLDQLPVLTDVMRYMDELALMHVPETSTGQGAALLMQQVDTLRESIVKDQDWATVGKQQFDSIFSKYTDAQDEDLRLIAEIYNEDNVGIWLDINSSEQMDLMSMPITLVSLSVQVNNCMVDVYNLSPCDEGTILPAARGNFRRTKMKLHSVAEDAFQFGKKLVLRAVVSVGGFENFKTLSLDSHLSEENENAMQWIQMGRTEEDKLVLQLGFKVSQQTNEHVYELRQAFVSQPV